MPDMAYNLRCVREQARLLSAHLDSIVAAIDAAEVDADLMQDLLPAFNAITSYGEEAAVRAAPNLSAG
jgi:hypothetical protein